MWFNKESYLSFYSSLLLPNGIVDISFTRYNIGMILINNIIKGIMAMEILIVNKTRRRNVL